MSPSAASSPRPRYAIVGLGGRAQMFVDALTRAHVDTAQLVAFCDVNQTRMDVHNRTVVDAGLPAVPTYRAQDFGRMLDAERVDTVIVTSIDRTHDEYIVAALWAGGEATTEKPM